jgi:ribosomal protein S21
MRAFKVQVAKTGWTSQFRKHRLIERRGMRRIISSGSHKSPINEL